ncbi:hypothetical protein N9E67_02430 [Amylibacter sp.]|nr:hypothetical protein [Amylibacter sp.]
MASHRKEHQEDARLRVFHITSINPQTTSWQIAQKFEISNGSAYNLLTSVN